MSIESTATPIGLALRTTRKAQNPAEKREDFDHDTTGRTTERPLLLRRVDVASLLNLAPRTFDRLLSTKKFPGPDIALNAKLIRWRRSTVESWVERGGKP